MKTIHLIRANNPSDGFSLVEVLVAAIIMASLLIGGNRLVLQGMASSGASAQRAKIEQEIMNDIESIQAIDTQISKHPELEKSCSQGLSSSQYLQGKIKDVPANSEWKREFDTSNPNLLVTIYSLTFPATNGSSITEKRIVELNPSYPTACPTS